MRLPSRTWLCTLPSRSSLPLVKRCPAHVLTREPATVERAIKNGRHNVVSLFFSFYKMLAKYRETFLGRNIRVQSVYAKTYYLFENILAGPRLISLFTHYEKKEGKILRTQVPLLKKYLGIIMCSTSWHLFDGAEKAS